MALGAAGGDTAAASAGGFSPPAPVPSKRQKQQPRPFDMSRYSQRHVALRIAYLGGAYQGYAYQAETPDTVEGRVLEALVKTCLITDRASSAVSCGGRTDKGVSEAPQQRVPPHIEPDPMPSSPKQRRLCRVCMAVHFMLLSAVDSTRTRHGISSSQLSSCIFVCGAATCGACRVGSVVASICRGI